MLGLGLKINNITAIFGGAPAPVFVSATTNAAGTIVTVTFDKEMADPTGYHAQFTVNDGGANPVTSCALNGTTSKIDLTLTNPVDYGDTVTVAYTAGDVTSADTGVLETFSAESVSNIVVEPPTFVSATTNEAGTIITVTFSKTMADPTGKHAQFTVSDGEANAVTGAALNGTTTKIDLTLTNTIETGDTVTVAYTIGTVLAGDGGILETFSAESVTNIVPSAYQSWTTYDDSPFLTATYPYQVILYEGGTTYKLFASKSKMYYVNDGNTRVHLNDWISYKWNTVSEDWDYQNAQATEVDSYFETLLQANEDIYTDSGLGTVYFAKTT